MDQPPRTCCITLTREGGRFAYTTSAASVFEAARNALRFWRDPFWQGPRPRQNDMLEVSATGDPRKWRVRVSRIDQTSSLPAGFPD